ncbi:alcohol dehydrogenase catalytic domain-containing protein [Dickeya fangzhongdai]|uniref:zinc-dependent alcohol dehydrogenase n=1 Tax=Dickeya fangzhongdai TaxID=1778540 RepID=UPI001EFA7076|nr:alcohol dehydrogenase catalytic domain-containing protein [Dickeya fangzhongdai]ULR30668.1 alcohol dehydrogenase catalytic domain-containing protein [Dickeya fangzhongdai]
MFYSLMCHGKRHQTYEPEALTPAPADFIRIEILKAAICGSDYMVLNQTHPYKQYPAILGHEFIGRIYDDEGLGDLKKGQWVTGLSYGSCGNCVYCKRGMDNHCLKKVTYNTAGSSGAFTHTMTVHHSSLAPLPLGRTADDHEFVLSEPLSIVVHALDKLTISHDSYLTVIGGGAMGLLSAIFCREVKNIQKVELVDKAAARCAFAQSLGFNASTDMSDVVLSETDILVIAGGEALNVNDYIGLLSPGARIVIISYFDTPVVVDMNMIVRKEITLQGSFLSNQKDLAKAIQIIEQSKTRDSRLKEIITDFITFAELRDFMLNKTSKGKVLIDKPGVLL